MSVQVFLQGKLLGIEQFVLAPAAVAAAGETVVAGRSYWVALLGEVLPRALLEQLGLARILLGASGGGGFLVVLPEESLPMAEAFLAASGADIEALSGGHLRLVWGATENLGDWTTVRKRLTEAMRGVESTVALAARDGAFAPRPAAEPVADDYFTSIAVGLREAKSAGWSPHSPGKVLLDDGEFTWPIAAPEGIPMARHNSLDEDGQRAATLAELGARAPGHPLWGVLRGDVDGFGVRMRRLNSVEEHIQLSVLFKQFFAGELELACTMGEFWRKVTILYTGGDDFAVYGAWDALVVLAREIQRLFHKFAEAHLKELPGPEGKTITMALELAPELDAPFAFVYEEAGRNLGVAKASGKDCIHIFGRTVEWRHLNHASDLKEMMMRMVREFGCPPQFLGELSGFYREKPDRRGDRPWRYHRRLSLVLGENKGRELQRLQTALITDLVGKNATQVKLRPAGRVAVEWARLNLEA